MLLFFSCTTKEKWSVREVCMVAMRAVELRRGFRFFYRLKCRNADDVGLRSLDDWFK